MTVLLERALERPMPASLLDLEGLGREVWEGIDHSDHVRARYEVATPDAIQLAAALSAGCASFLTNDRRLPRIPGRRVIQLEDYVGAA